MKKKFYITFFLSIIISASFSQNFILPKIRTDDSSNTNNLLEIVKLLKADDSNLNKKCDILFNLIMERKFKDGFKFITTDILPFYRNFDFYLIKGYLEMNVENYYSAIDNFNIYLINEDTTLIGYEGRSIAFYNIGKYEQSLMDIDTAISRKITEWKLYVTKAMIFSALKEYDKSLSNLKTALALGGDYYLVVNERASCYNNLEMYYESLNDYKYLYSIKPSPKNIVGIARNLLQLEKYDSSLMLLNKAIKIDSNYYNAYLLRAYLYDKIYSEYSKSIKDYNKLEALTNKTYNLYEDRGYNYYKLKEYKNAIRDMKLSISEFHQENWFAYGCIGMSYIFLKNKEEGCKYLTKAIEICDDEKAKNNFKDICK